MTPTVPPHDTAADPAPLPFERRRSERTPCVAPCKVHRAGAGRYLAGESANVSQGGVLLRVPRDETLRIGERARVAIAQGAGAVLRDESLRPARVVRVQPMDCHHQAVALAFEAEAALASAA